MFRYIIRRILYAIPVLFAILLVTFTLARLIPGDPCKAMLGEKATQESCERFNRKFGLDQPIPTQFALYMGNILRGDLGDSIRFGRPIAVMLAERLPMTIELGLTAMFIAVLIGIPAGLLSALRRNSAIDVVTMVGANFGVSIPVFVLGLLLIYGFAVLLRDTPLALPPSGRLSPGVSSRPFYDQFGWNVDQSTPGFLLLKFVANMYVFNALITADWRVLGDALKHLLLPALALSTIPLSIIARMTRSSVLEVLGQDYIRTARAKGLHNRLVVFRHALRSALLPVVTIIGLQTGAILSGAVLTETIFGLSGVGRSLYEAITSRDFPVIQGFTIVIASIYVLFNLLVDISYAFLDPRVRLR
ncbi:ABC transporter permease [Litorilinea aerophila]|uniref:ABC transporter permease n=1 Tax=Litorilinea aerophila TaxID=1204385 RepID=A0A540VJ61_9CHLR|nr:ABC transporter permease [Litorilinea aerophila]MCC9075611.1 ABC transporter permease [Litorilinea aerophila]GIV79185.1 MAG: peptide ABC transporter permease [Litorilinea sp.]